MRSVGSDTPSRSNILLAAKANEYRPDKCIRVELPDESDIQARLNVVDHPDLIGRKVLLHADIVAANGSVRIANVTEQEGGKEPVEKPDPEDPDQPENRTTRRLPSRATSSWTSSTATPKARRAAQARPRPTSTISTTARSSANGSTCARRTRP